jgi:pimeloyl-ACP methyl ester carboxylesterase
MEGDRVLVDERYVHVRCAGPLNSAEMVVLLAGLPGALSTFDELQADLSSQFRVCAYDRLGEGDSDEPGRDQTLDDCVSTLHRVLAQVAGADKRILVGHSLGGLLAAAYAHRYPDRVHGLVLLDATPPGSDQEIMELIPSSATGIAAAIRAEATSLTTGRNPERLIYHGEPIGPLKDLPMAVVAHGKPVFSAVPEYGQQLEKLRTAGQRSWTTLSSRARLVTAENSGHYIYLDEPELTRQLIMEIAGM